MLSTRTKTGSVFTFEGVPSLRKSIPLALQHVVAMVVGCCAPALLIADMAGLDPMRTTVMVQAALLLACLATLLQLFPIGPIGARLPLIMGVSFAYVPTMQSIVEQNLGMASPVEIIAIILGAQLIGSVAAIVFGIFLKKLKGLFPPIVAGTVVFTIGISLWPTAVNYMAGGVGSATYGAPLNWLVALVTLAVVLLFTHFSKGFFKLASVLIGLLVGYALAVILGMVDFSKVVNERWFQLPRPFAFGLRFEGTAIASMIIMYVVNSVQAIGDMSGTTSGAMDRMPTEKELKGGIICNGVCNTVGAVFGGLPTATFSQNVGIVTTTKVVNRIVLAIAAVIIGVAGLFPKIAALLTTIPNAVLGGATITVFASISMTGIRLIVGEKLTGRTMAIVGLAVSVGVGITNAPGSLAGFPAWVNTIFGSNMVTVSTLLVILLNVMIPKEKGSED